MMNTIKFGIWGFGRMGAPHGRFYAMERDKLKYRHDTIRNDAPFPIKNRDAFETVRIMQAVKRQNPQFAWKHEDTSL